MAFRPLPARAPAVLLREARPLKALFSQAQRLAQLQRLVESQLQPAAREHCHVASWREGTLLLIVTDGHWATRLRYQQKRLLRQLQMMEAFSSLTRINFRVQPVAGVAPAAGHPMDISTRSAQNIHATAEGITDPQAQGSTGASGQARQGIDERTALANLRVRGNKKGPPEGSPKK